MPAQVEFGLFSIVRPVADQDDPRWGERGGLNLCERMFKSFAILFAFRLWTSFQANCHCLCPAFGGGLAPEFFALLENSLILILTGSADNDEDQRFFVNLGREDWKGERQPKSGRTNQLNAPTSQNATH